MHEGSVVLSRKPRCSSPFIQGLVDSGQHLQASSTHESRCKDDGLAPSTNEDLRQAEFEPREVPVSQSSLGNIEEKVGGSATSSRTAV